ncbi:MAG TPA: PAS domain-containing protein [Rhizomicrobium sp.]|nr:PAS domain-containing protein [Rhizomicrobium sp.]
MKHRNSHLLVGYWSRLRRGRAVPDQTDIDPRAIKRMLSYVFILDAKDIERPLYRLAGTSLCERFGTELRGISFLSHWEGQSRTALAGILKQSLAARQPLCLSSIAATADCGMVECETVLAPVSFNNEEPTRFIGMVQILTDVNALAGKPIAFERLVASQMIREDEPLPIPDFPPPATLDSLRGASRPRLRLVVSQQEPQPSQPVEHIARLLDVFGTGIAVDAQAV